MQAWYAVQTKPHKEFMVRDALANLRDVHVYLPVLHVDPINPRARRIRAFFPSYLFFHTDLSSVGLSTIRWNPGVARVLGCGDRPTSISAPVIEQIRKRVEQIQEKGAFVLDDFQHGDRVRITSGLFDGYEGMFDTRLGGQTRTRILIEFLGRLTAAEVDIRHLEKVSRKDGAP
jgi:transcription antitermination factor NusG